MNVKKLFKLKICFYLSFIRRSSCGDE